MARLTALRRGADVARRLPLAASGAARRFAEDPWRGWAALARALPRTVAGSPTDPVRAFDLAVARDDATTATSELARMAPDDQRRASSELSLRRLQGDLVAVIEAPTGDRRGRRVQASARRQLDHLSATLPSWASVTRPLSDAPAPAGQPRILHVVTNSLPLTQAGSTIRTQRVVQAQCAAGWDSRVVTRPGYPVTHGDLDAADVETVDGVQYLRLLPAVMPRPADLPRVYREMLGEVVDVTNPHLLHAASDHVNARAALEVGRLRGIPVAYEVRSFFEDTWLSRHAGGAGRGSDVYRLLKARHDEVMRASDLVTTLGHAMRAEILDRGVDPERVVVVPNAVPDDYLADLSPASEARRLLAIPEGLWIGSVATINEAEGLHILIEAIARLRDQGLDARALIVGDGPALAGLRAQARSLDVPLWAPGRIPVAEVRTYYDALDVFALPRIDSALNRLVTALKPLEAQARSRPVVGSDLPAVAEVLAPGLPLVPPGDARALAEALGTLADPSERLRLGDIGHSWVASCRTWASVTGTYGTAYASIGAPARAT